MKNDHNMWSYIYYFLYLDELEESEYSSLDLFVANQVKPMSGLGFKKTKVTNNPTDLCISERLQAGRQTVVTST